MSWVAELVNMVITYIVFKVNALYDEAIPSV